MFVGLNYDLVMLWEVPLVEQDGTTYTSLKKIPFLIPVFVLLVLVSKALFIAAVVSKVVQEWKLRHKTG